MRRTRTIVSLVGLVALTVLVATGQAQTGTPTSPPTFSRDIAPILHAQCAECHRPGEVAPMSLLTYAEARPWAAAIARRVADGSMPPWHADAARGTFENERRLTPAEKDAIACLTAGGPRRLTRPRRAYAACC
jgi:hypothetical protein